MRLTHELSPIVWASRHLDGATPPAPRHPDLRMIHAPGFVAAPASFAHTSLGQQTVSRKGEKNMNAPEKDKELAAIIDRLEREFPDVPPPEVVAVILEAHDAFQDYPITSHVPVIVERQAKNRLRGRAGQSFQH
jgi:hypothetical protein